MKRITKVIKIEEDGQRTIEYSKNQKGEVAFRLSYYEDTGLTPYGAKWFAQLLLHALKEQLPEDLADYFMIAIRNSNTSDLFLEPEKERE